MSTDPRNGADWGPDKERDCTFYVILRSDDFRLHRHSSKLAAKRELARLAKQCPDSKFYLLETAFAAGPIEPPVQIRDLRDEIPF